MHSNVNLEAAAGALGFVGAGLLLAVLGLVFLYSLLRGRRRRAGAALVLGLGVALLYAWLLAAFSLASKEEVLARGVEKYFCEVDCHLAYSVVGVRRAKILGHEPAAGVYYVVTLRTRFDERTVSKTRGNRPLLPNPRRVEVADAAGRTYGISYSGQAALKVSEGAGRPLDTPLAPGESYTTELVFDLPEGARGLTLLIREDDAVTRYVVGHENSPLHAKTRFRLEPDGPDGPDAVSGAAGAFE